MDTSLANRPPLFSSCNYVPFNRVKTLLFSQTFLLFLSPYITCSRNLLQPTTSYTIHNSRDNFQDTYFSATPPLGIVKNYVRNYQNTENTYNGNQPDTSDNLYGEDSTNNLFSPVPVFDFQPLADNYELSLAPTRIQRRHLITPVLEADATESWIDSLADVESGSGEVWEEHPENSIGYESTPAASIMPTSVLGMPNNYGISESTPALDDAIYNRAPVLNRRIPKLSLVSGQIWKYYIPADTFIDEDGDLRSLQSSVFIKTTADSLVSLDVSADNDNGSSSSLDRYFSWIQYNQSSRLLYALPTENNAGKHELVLVASDRWSATGRENLELQVKQHLSVRAFTHLVSVNRVEWNRHKYPSIVDVLIRFIKRISERIFLSQNTDDFIVKSYTINDFSIQTTNDQETTPAAATSISTNIEHQTTSFSLSWSNSSLPVHPCHLDLLDAYLRPLVDGMSTLSSNNQPTTNLNPSPSLIKAMYPDFILSNISVDLKASCQDIRLISKQDNFNKLPSNFNTSTLRVRMKIGILNLKLGEPIEYQIPRDTFELEGAGETKGIQMSLYTIDGMLLNKDPRYRFLEFDEETNTLFGLPYDMKQHTGQRELMLTAEHPASGSRVREVFMVNIEPQDLTMINNRAFKMSLYFGIRMEEFGPRERILMSHKIVQALRVSPSFGYKTDPSQFIITDIHKFLMPDYSGGGSLYDSSPGQPVKVFRVNDEDAPNKDAISLQHRRYFYKFSWTNSSIGYRGDCPVEVINENVFFALEQTMLDLEVTSDLAEDLTKNDSLRFYERLRLYFEPEFDLIHLRFEPLGACQGSLDSRVAGSSEVADSVEKLLAADLGPFELSHQQQESNVPYMQLGTPKVVVEPDSDEYWSIIVLIVLVMVLIFVIIMFFLGIHTYKINQDKKFELQVRLAQARQNSMYLSSMILANQTRASDICAPDVAGNQEHIKNAKSLYVIQDEDKKHRKPTMIVDNDLTIQQQLDMQQSTVGLVATKQANGRITNEPIMQHSFPLIKPNSTLNNIQPNGWSIQQPSSSLMMDDKHLSMTLNRRFSSSIHHKLVGPLNGTINHSQSILTVASIGGPVSLVSNAPVVYGPGAGYPAIIGHQPVAYVNHQNYQPAPELVSSNSNGMFKKYPQQNNKTPLVDSLGNSPSYSSSASGTTQSAITNPYYR